MYWKKLRFCNEFFNQGRKRYSKAKITRSDEYDFYMYYSFSIGSSSGINEN